MGHVKKVPVTKEKMLSILDQVLARRSSKQMTLLSVKPKEKVVSKAIRVEKRKKSILKQIEQSNRKEEDKPRNMTKKVRFMV